tara:strand:- start:50 stop:889 length:840 start_codon:yes stop_codon:yes gene_type:complete
MNFVTCNLVGPSTIGGVHYFGLANQMFQIATAISYGKENNLTPIFPMLNNKKYGNYTEDIFRKLSLDEYKSEDIKLHYCEPSFSFTKIPQDVNVKLDGYFQSEKYFLTNRDLILDIFSPTNKILDYIKSKYKSILEDSISVHLRYGDYEKIQDHHPLISKSNYYENILKINKRKNILIFSDNIKKAKRVKAFKNHEVHFIHSENEVTDLFLMSMCNDNAIANSSFSWWGAWLNNNTNKKVYAPTVWFGPAKNDYDTKDLLPEGWIKVESKFKKKFFELF